MPLTPITTRGRNAPKRYIGWSYTKLANFAQCPRKHLECDIEKRWNAGETNDHIEFGNAVHTAMEQRIKHGKPIPVHLQMLMAADMEEWALRVTRDHPTAADFEKATGGHIGVELQLAITEDLQPCEWFDKQRNVWGRAKVDIALGMGQVMVLYDWKTGKISDRDNKQLLLSAGIAFAHYPHVQAIRTCYVWLKEDATTTLDVTRDEMTKFWADVLPEINHYRASVAANEFPERPSKLCGWCPVATCQHNPRYGS